MCVWLFGRFCRRKEWLYSQIYTQTQEEWRWVTLSGCRTFKGLCGKRRKWTWSSRSTWLEPFTTSSLCAILILATSVWELSPLELTESLEPPSCVVGKLNSMGFPHIYSVSILCFFFFWFHCCWKALRFRNGKESKSIEFNKLNKKYYFDFSFPVHNI